MRTTAEFRETVEACQRAAQRMRHLIESLLELARLDAGQEPMKRVRFDLSAKARECLESVQPLAEQRRVTIRSELPVCPCDGDPERIAQVITNLLTNAVHYNKDEGQLRVRAQASQGLTVLSVSDSGPGIPPEHLPHIFERFYRADKSRSASGGRTGLGLAIAKAIVTAHGGTIEAESPPHDGAVFTIRLPLDSERAI